MKIGIISSGMESLALFSFLHRHDQEYLIYYDSLNAPYGEKHFETSLQAVREGIERLKNKEVDLIILPPVYELYLLQEKKEKLIAPLFQTYLLTEVFAHSLVGKLGIFGEYADLEKAQSLLTELANSYTPTPTQKATKTFHFPFKYRSKECGILNPLLSRLSRKSILTNTLLKHELRYFKDAAVDSLIPLNYLYFNTEKTIAKFLNFRKIRFHRQEKLEKIFLELTKKKEKSEYSISIFATDQTHSLLREKRLLRYLQRWKSAEIHRIA